MPYELYYWPEIQGRGEFVRLALEDAGADYVDVARQRGKGGGVEAMLRLMDGRTLARPPFAPPFLRSGEQLIGQTANILLFLGRRLGLAPRSEAGRLWAHQLQLTIADLVDEAHDTHHPIASSLYYEDQKREAKRRTADFLGRRVPKYLGYFERLIEQSGGTWLLGRKLTYPDLSLFQVVAGLEYAFPRAFTQAAKAHPRILALAGRVKERPRIAAYLSSPRRIPFNEMGIFRHYPELDRP
ncbi:MAG TPA: glutathione S-transferase family protein [Stellaceae bacterium]|nr:glutathione S-transferase family protein [Stellaceae bacterium]